MNLSIFQEFFDHCVGQWATERTYHYLTRQAVERSHTDFQVQPISNDGKTQVLADNRFPAPDDLDPLPGYHLDFATLSERGDRVNQSLNLLFVPQKQTDTLIVGDYLRDRAYEEDRPIISHFQFNTQTRELLMTTRYTQVVSVDSITLMNPQLRIRKILNYARPSEGSPLQQVLLVGFGVEQKQPTP